jgi:outer membrane receptor for monomeric catechols
MGCGTKHKQKYGVRYQPKQEHVRESTHEGRQENNGGQLACRVEQNSNIGVKPRVIHVRQKSTKSIFEVDRKLE